MMHVGTSARLHDAMRVAFRRAVLPTCIVLVSCGANRVPAALRGYDILVPGEDSQSVELARVMRAEGYKVRGAVKGGSHRTAAVIHFLYAEPGPDQPTWLHLRLADTRSGAIVGVASIQLDSALTTPHARAVAAVAAIVGP
jgi:hypothetical protein